MARPNRTTQGPNWKKRILIPFWVIRMAIMTFCLGTFIWAAVTLSNSSLYSEYNKPAIGAVVVTILFISIILLVDILAIIMFIKNKLNAGLFVLLNCIGTAFWGIILILEIASVGSSSGGNGASIGLGVFIFLTFLGLLIYSSIMYHRERKARKQGTYAAAHNPASTTPYNNTPYNNSPYQQQTSYIPAPNNAQELPEYNGKVSSGSRSDFSSQPVRPAQGV